MHGLENVNSNFSSLFLANLVRRLEGLEGVAEVLLGAVRGQSGGVVLSAAHGSVPRADHDGCDLKQSNFVNKSGRLCIDKIW